MDMIGGRKILSKSLRCALFAFAALNFLPEPAAAQEELEHELVANLSTGHVLIAVTKDGIVLGTAGSQAEVGSRPPSVIPLGGRRIAILLGATEWVTLDSSAPPIRLDAELPRLINEATGPKHLGTTEDANDIELIGVTLLERIRAVAESLHRKVAQGPDEPLVEMLLVDYLENYGPEVWEFRYRVEQDALRGEFWRTRVLRPMYNQLYPPEKGQPKTLIEVRYPPEEKTDRLMDLLARDDPKLTAIGHADPRMAEVVEGLLHGESPKLMGEDTAAFLRAALPVVSRGDAKLALGVLYEHKAIEWLIAPPPVQSAADEQARPAGAPTLRKKPE